MSSNANRLWEERLKDKKEYRSQRVKLVEQYRQKLRKSDLDGYFKKIRTRELRR